MVQITVWWFKSPYDGFNHRMMVQITAWWFKSPYDGSNHCMMVQITILWFKSPNDHIYQNKIQQKWKRSPFIDNPLNGLLLANLSSNGNFLNYFISTFIFKWSFINKSIDEQIYSQIQLFRHTHISHFFSVEYGFLHKLTCFWWAPDKNF